jgi:tetratricopeptide (TPR) repeat protein
VAARTARNRARALAAVLACALAAAAACSAGSADALFQDGAAAYRAGDYSQAVQAFSQSAALRPASGTLQNLGNAQWQAGQAAPAIVAWEQALWLDPFNRAARNNLRFARKIAQVDAPEVSWYEVISTWLPIDWWAWMTGASLWLAVGVVLLPGIFRRPKAAWHQAVAALGLMVFLLCVPAHIGVHTRARIGFVTQKDAPLRLTPTQDAQAVTRLSAGEPARWIRSRGGYALVRTARAVGWLEKSQFRLVCPGD